MTCPLGGECECDSVEVYFWCLQKYHEYKFSHDDDGDDER